MATAPLGASNGSRENPFIANNDNVKSFAPKAKTEVEPAKTVQQTKQAAPAPAQAKRSEPPPKPAPVVNTQGQVTGTRINTSA